MHIGSEREPSLGKPVASLSLGAVRGEPEIGRFQARPDSAIFTIFRGFKPWYHALTTGLKTGFSEGKVVSPPGTLHATFARHNWAAGTSP